MFDFSEPGNFRLHYAFKHSLYQPPVDVIEVGETYLFRIEIAGMNEKDFQIRLDNNVLFVSGTRHDPHRKHVYQQMEIHFGDFNIEIAINFPIEPNTMAASYLNGFLEISLEKAVTHNISIKNKDEQ
jgi:HSP20 family protein